MNTAMLYKGKDVNNNDVGKDLLSVIDEIYVEAKLYNDNITHDDVMAIIRLYEQYINGSEEETKIVYPKGMDISGLMEDL